MGKNACNGLTEGGTKLSYQIVTDATADMCPAMRNDLPQLLVLPMEIMVGEDPFTYGPDGNISAEEFYAKQRSGKFASTSQINPVVYTEYFEKILKRGMDILYLCFSSGLSGSIQNAQIAVSELSEKYPERKLICIDTLCASVGEGFLVREALRKQAEGMELSELAEWVQAHCLEVCHWFTVDTFEHLKHGGRVSAAAAAMGTLLQIKPMLHVDREGRLEVKEKPRGKKRAMAAQLERMKKGWDPSEGRLVVIGHGDDPERAEELKNAVLKAFPEAEVYIAPIGPVIGAHTGPGMLALIFWGTER